MAKYVFYGSGLIFHKELPFYFRVLVNDELVDGLAISHYLVLSIRDHWDGLRGIYARILVGQVLLLQCVDLPELDR